MAVDPAIRDDGVASVPPPSRVSAVRAPNTTNTPAVIASGGNLSASVDIGPGVVLSGIQMPAAWTAAVLTFQVSADGVTYGNKFDAFGTEYQVASASATAGQFISLPPSDFVNERYIKVRSGTSGATVAQTPARTFVLVAG